MFTKVFIAGGAGFIGSHFVDYLLSLNSVKKVTVYDNLSSGSIDLLKEHASNSKLNVVTADICDSKKLQTAMSGHETVIHLASNPDIARAVTEPAIDFTQGTLLTHEIVEAMRITGAQRLIYASGSGVYGEAGELELREDHGPLIPISTYGASKLAGEALICAYAHMFDISGIAFRFGNVVGARQTHGVGYDFLKKLRANPHELTVLGDGQQSKSYVHISDIVAAVFLASQTLASPKLQRPFDVFNVATGDYITVETIAHIAIEKILGKNAKVKLNFTGQDRGWKGDVPVVRLATDKIKSLGWVCQFSSHQSIEKSFDEMLG